MGISDVYVPAKGPISPRIALVGESPSFEEVDALEPFVGPSGRFLNSMLSEAGIKRDECWTTNCCKYFVPFEEKKSFLKRADEAGIDLQKQFSELRAELLAIRPNIVVPLGGTALWACTGKKGIQDYRGSILSAFGIKAIPTFHPAHILHQDKEVKGYWTKAIMHFDLCRIKGDSEYPENNLPKRVLSICENSGQLFAFLERYKHCDYLSVDIEAKDCIPVCIGLAFSANEGMCVPLWNRDSISQISDGDMVNIWRLLAEVLENKKIVGQNFNYDRDKLSRLGFSIPHFSEDTMLRAFCINPELPKNLAFNTSIYTREPFYKNEGMYEGELHDLFIGCARDACVTYEIRDAQQRDMAEINITPYYEKFLLPLFKLYGEIENNGFRVDEQVRAELIRKYVEWDENIRHELFSLTGDYVNSSSPQQVSHLLYEKFRIPHRKGTGEEILTALLNNTVKKPEQRRVIELILEDRRVKRTINGYLQSPVDFDGRMKSTFFICLETGRTATGMQDPPIRPSITVRNESGQKKQQSRGMAFQTITKHGDIGSDIRSMLIADVGEIFLQADSSQAEARVVFLLAEDYEALRLIDEIDYHAETASWFFGGTRDDYSKKKLGYEHPIRFAGKTLRHAGHLGASKKTAAIEVNTQARKYKIDISISEQKAAEALEIFHRKQPKIKQVFQKQVIECINKNRQLIAPVPYGIDAPVGGTRTFFERYGDDLFRQAFSYIPQRTVSENTKGAALRIVSRAGKYIKIIVESHDALLVSVPIDRKEEAKQILKEEFERPIDFSTCSLKRGKLIIPCEIESGFDYLNLKKEK